MTNPTRTCNARRPLVRSEFGSLIQVIAALGRRYIPCVSWGAGRGGRIRTGDLLNPIQVRYRTALRPDEAHASIRLHPLQEKETSRTTRDTNATPLPPAAPRSPAHTASCDRYPFPLRATPRWPAES